MNEFIQNAVRDRTLAELLRSFPVLNDFLENLRLSFIDTSLPAEDAILNLLPEDLADFDLSPADVYDQFLLFFERFAVPAASYTDDAGQIQVLTLIGGRDKCGCPEECHLDVFPGEVVSIVGPTGSGKSRLLEDIECLAQGDTPTGRRILLNRAPVPDSVRFGGHRKPVAQLTQNMNFVMDLSVGEFLDMHARCRPQQTETANRVESCFQCAIRLAGEPFELSTKLTQLSGGQSRALMIADTACMSSSPILLVDEIENAGIHRQEAIELLARKEKIVFLSTHDPLLALNVSKRIIIKNGAVFRILETDDAERRSLQTIERLDSVLRTVRDDLRSGKRISLQ